MIISGGSMSNNWLVEQIDLEIAKLQQAKQLLLEVERKDGRVRPSRSTSVSAKPISRKGRVMSPEAKARIAAAQKARWAKQKKAASKKAVA
jgi:hypothetical protein